MSYNINGKIQSSDYNGFVQTNTPNVNEIWAGGTGDKGYGQTPLPTVVTGEKIRATHWLNLINTISRAANHQGTAITTVLPVPTAGGKIISFTPVLENNIIAIDGGSSNASAQGTDIIYTEVNNSSTWTDSLTFVFTITFSSHQAIRYFFNGGGQIGINFSHPAGFTYSINQLISDISSEFGTMWLSSPTSGTVNISGTPFNGVTKIGGVASSRGVANTNNGFYALTSTASQCYRQYGDVPYSGYYYYYDYTSGTFLDVSAAYDGAGELTIIGEFDEVPNGAVVSTGTTANLTIRPPSTVYISNVWGTPAVTSFSIPV